MERGRGRGGGGGGQQRGGGRGGGGHQGGRGGGYQGDRGGHQGGGRGGGYQGDRGGHQGGGRGGGYQGDRGGHQGGGRGGGYQGDRGGHRGGQGGGGGGYQGDRGGRGGGYGGGRGGGGRGGFGGGGRGGRGPPPMFIDSARCPDPYLMQYTEEQKKLYQQQGWKPFDATCKDEVRLQVYKGPEASWALNKINVSVNHFPVQSTKGSNAFPFPTVYHYDISYEMLRKGKSAEPKPGPSTEQPSKGKGKKKKGPNVPAGGGDAPDVGDLNIDDDGKKRKGEAPPNKKLPKYLTQMILSYLIPKIRKETKHHGIVTDLSFNMYSTKRIHGKNPEANVPTQWEVNFDELRKEKYYDEDDEASVRVVFEPSMDKTTGEVKTISTASIAAYFQQHNGTMKGLDLPNELRQTVEAVCNAFVKSFPTFRYFPVGRSSMVPQINADSHRLGGGIVAWRGVSANIGMGWKPYLNVDIANCTFMLNQKVLEVLKEVFDNMRSRATPSDITSWRHKELDEARTFLKTCKVSYDVKGTNGIVKRFGGPVTDLPKKSVKEATFRWEDKKKTISVFDYYKEQYGLTLQNPNGPVLQIRKKALIPAELCTIKKGQSYNRKLDGNQTSSMLGFAKRNPDDLENDIHNQIRDMKLKQNEVLKELGIQVPDRMLQMEARVLVPPTLRYGPQKGFESKIAHINPEGGAWDVWQQDFSFYKPVTVKKWGVLVVGCERIRGTNDQSLNDFIGSLMRNGRKKSVNFTSEPYVAINTQCRRDNEPKQNSSILKNQLLKEFKDCELVVVVFPQKGSPLYGQVKHAAEVDVGILTQCVAERNVTMVKDATVQNILLKINSKLGGINHVVVAPFEPEKASKFSKLITDCPLLVLGADVTHAPPGARKQMNGQDFIMPSYAAVTGSLDKTCMPFMTEVQAQRKANAGAAEVIQNLDRIVEKMLRMFQTRSKVIPRKIIYFRDGVGDGQFPEVLHIEMNAIRNACKAINANYQPKITFITVQKRHKTRIFFHPVAGRTENAPAGTVIDSEIVHPSETDFYLLSHKGMLGTSRPSRYHVLWDDSDFSQDVLQSLAYTLCYMYVRCTKSVKIPAPTYYAHLAADRAKKLCEGLEDKYGDPTEENLNKILKRHDALLQAYPMHFV